MDAKKKETLVWFRFSQCDELLNKFCVKLSIIIQHLFSCHSFSLWLLAALVTGPVYLILIQFCMKQLLTYQEN